MFCDINENTLCVSSLSICVTSGGTWVDLGMCRIPNFKISNPRFFIYNFTNPYKNSFSNETNELSLDIKPKILLHKIF